MAERRDLPRIMPKDDPFLHPEVGGWAYVGGIAGGLVAGIAMISFQSIPIAAALSAGLLFEFGGAYFGHMRGEERVARERREGRVVKEPTYLNNGIWNGIFVSSVITTLALIGIDLLTNLAVLDLPLVIGGPLALIPIACMIGGSIMRHNEMEHDVAQAVQMQHQMGHAVSRGHAHGHGYMNSVSAAEAAELANKQEAKASHAERSALEQHAAQHAGR